MRYSAGIVVLGVAAALGCATMITLVDYDRSADFSRYKTFGFQRGTPARRDFMQRRIEEVIASTLQSKGLAAAKAEKPDLRVFTHVVIEREQRIDTIVYGYGWRWGGGVATTRVTDFPVGTLIVDLVDTETKELVWRGKASDTIDRDSEAREEQLREAVAKMFERFPPEPESKGSTRER
jgi:hypothetical protein